jgi:antitoxin ParD1/3/4
MEISLTAEQSSVIERQVKSGRFASTEEAISEAVALLEQSQEDHLDIEVIRRETQAGMHQLDRGEGIELETEADWDQFKADIKARGRALLVREQAATTR